MARYIDGYWLNNEFYGIKFPEQPIPELPYLCFTANTAGSTVQLNKDGNPTVVQLETSTDGITRTDYTIGDTITLTNEGDKIYWRNKSETPTGFSNGTTNYYNFVMSGSVAGSGDINYLLCKNSTTTLTTDYCYFYLFTSCSSLTTAPKFPATTLTKFCYCFTFRGCPSLTTLPELPATTFPDYCCFYMFLGCSNIKLSETQTGEYQTPYRIPSNGTGTTARQSLDYMFDSTGGTFTGGPQINTTYYTSNQVI